MSYGYRGKFQEGRLKHRSLQSLKDIDCRSAMPIRGRVSFRVSCTSSPSAPVERPVLKLFTLTSVLASSTYHHWRGSWHGSPPVKVSQSHIATRIDEWEHLQIVSLSAYRRVRWRVLPTSVAIIKHVTSLAQSFLAREPWFHEKRNVMVDAEGIQTDVALEVLLRLIGLWASRILFVSHNVIETAIHQAFPTLAKSRRSHRALAYLIWGRP